MQPTDHLRAQLQQLSDGFRQRLKQQLPALRDQALELAAQQKPDLQSLEPIRDQLHMLAGSAGSFGFAEVGVQARELEQLANRCLRDGFGETCRQELADGIALLGRLPLGPAPEEPITDQMIADTCENRGIQVLEANPDLAMRMSQTLESFGYRVERHADAESLTSALRAHQPDALVIDVSPAGPGYQMLETIAELQSSWSHPMPLIAVSDNDDFDIQIAAVRAGAQGFFTRPVDLAALENRLERCFGSLQNEPFRILVVDDDTALAARFATVLSAAGMLVETVEQPRQLLEHIDNFLPDVIVMDVHMPGYSGPELAQMIRLHDNWLRVPILYLSAETDLGRQMAALLKAGDDFITKPISDSALLTTVFSRAQRARLVSRALARDSLTGLLKHADIKEQVELEVERSQRTHMPVSVAMIDIDHFKLVNDRHGHGVGDNVIRALANLLRQRLRKIDRLGRYGGEEFVAVLPNCNTQDAKSILDDIRKGFEALQFSGSEGPFQCTFSAGVSACEAPEWQTEEVLERADAGLYQAKAQGRNRIVAPQQKQGLL
ncbi:response regulator receiver modulated diguanylate cyclase [Halopseudomonas xinjiangensis]|uniref:diguanylate cyclase n=1 Tax=Halopseudomonas xinjiangensis TaxID=487184 RepID=A0A1H1XYF0_9GAMM|nr:diguanylate cyclase [Halopseudomonas xinjiangensis]SDT14297.1 response regulator receiver modulated diguanylate cyclase [Halopseudomonas xinjiangensis]